MQGHLGRFINHSCEPNCRTEFWRVAGDELAIGLFAQKDIPAESELTFDYNFERYGDKVRPRVHSLHCSHTINSSTVLLCPLQLHYMQEYILNVTLLLRTFETI